MQDQADGPQDVQCSRKGCRAVATTDLQWRNPRIHGASPGSRVKHWVACDEHADYLAQYLSVRGFLLDRGPLRQPPR